MGLNLVKRFRNTPRRGLRGSKTLKTIYFSQKNSLIQALNNTLTMFTKISI